MNLHETEYGRRFFNSQLPSLIKALERIAENLSAPKQSLSADFVADPDFLHDLYYGDYEPSVFKTQSEHQKQLKVPEIYNKATSCVWRDGAWLLMEDTETAILLSAPIINELPPAEAAA